IAIRNLVPPTTTEWNTLLHYLHELSHLRELKIADQNITKVKCELPDLNQLEALFVNLYLANPQQTLRMINKSWNKLSRFCDFSHDRNNRPQYVDNPFIPGQRYVRYFNEIDFQLSQEIR